MAARKEKPLILEMVKVVLGGAGGLVFAWVIVKYGLGRDPFGPSPPRQDEQFASSVETPAATTPTSTPVPVPTRPTAILVPPASLPVLKPNVASARRTEPDSTGDDDDTTPLVTVKRVRPSIVVEDAVDEPKDTPREPVNIPVITVKSEPLEIGAVIAVDRMKPVSIAARGREKIDPYLIGGTEFEWIDPPKSAQTERGELRFTVEQSGWVYMAAYWYREGNDSGGWTKTRLTKEQLVELGWQHLGLCPWDGAPPQKPVELFKRFCHAGESHSIRTNKYGPPALFTPPRVAPEATN